MHKVRVDLPRGWAAALSDLSIVLKSSAAEVTLDLATTDTQLRGLRRVGDRLVTEPSDRRSTMVFELPRPIDLSAGLLFLLRADVGPAPPVILEGLLRDPELVSSAGAELQRAGDSRGAELLLQLLTLSGRS